MNPTQALSDIEIDELDDFLLSDEMPENCMDISTLDGFFAALVINPRFIMPGEYLPWIWDMEQGKEGPAFASLEHANRIMQLLMRYYNSLLEAIVENEFAPLFYTLEQDDGSDYFDAEGWCEGFMLGVSLFHEQWKEVLEKHPELFAPMVLLGTEDGWNMLEETADNRQATRIAYESIAESVALLYDRFSEQREAEMQKFRAQGHPSSVLVESVKMSFGVGSNEECPCGSGKIFSKCCGAPPTLH